MKLRGLYEQLTNLLRGLDYLFVSHSFYTTRGGEVRESIRINFDRGDQVLFLLPSIRAYCCGIQGVRVDVYHYEIEIEMEA